MVMAVSPAAMWAGSDARVLAEPTQLCLALAFLFWSILALGLLPLCSLDAASVLLVPAGGAGRGWALGRVIIHVRDVVRDVYFGCHFWKKKKIPTGVKPAFPHQMVQTLPRQLCCPQTHRC